MTWVENGGKWLKCSLGLHDNSPIINSVRPYYDSFLNVLYGQSGLPRRFNGEPELRIRPRYRNYKNEYEPEAVDYLRSVVRPGSVVLEVGANMGSLTMLMSRWVGASGKVYAFEPAPEARTALEDHLELNKLAGRVVVLPLAVSDTVGTSMFFADGSSGQNTLAPAHSRIPNAIGIKVHLTSIDAFCKENNIVPHVLKIDVEGYEYQVLRGAVDTLQRHKPVALVEFHPQYWNEIGTKAEEFRSFFREIGYSVRPLTRGDNPFTDYSHASISYDGSKT